MEEKFKIASIAKDLRLCIIENSIFIEELVSIILCDILNIDWKTSKSFGPTSGSLSFNQKLQLIQDIKGIDKDDLKKLRCLANIRNKFAHVSQIDSFERLFSDSSVGKEIKMLFLKWFFDEKDDTDIQPSKVESIYRLCFYLLVNNVIEILLKISTDHSFNLGFLEGQKEVKDELLDIFKAIVTPKQQLAVLEAIDKFKNQ